MVNIILVLAEWLLRHPLNCRASHLFNTQDLSGRGKVVGPNPLKPLLMFFTMYKRF